jgi:hypothetical protein
MTAKEGFLGRKASLAVFALEFPATLAEQMDGGDGRNLRRN